MIRSGVKMISMENNNYLSVNRIIIGKNIRNARLTMGYTIEELAEQLDLSWSYVGLIERGERCPSLSTLLEICKIFLLTPNDLICGNTQYNSSSKDSRQNKILRIETIISQFSDNELEFVVKLVKQMGKLRISKE